jgi:2-iminoacetate synthase
MTRRRRWPTLDPGTERAFGLAGEMVYGASREDVARALSAEMVGLRELAALLSPRAGPLLEQMARRAEQTTRRRFGRTVVLYVPLYLSNECTNACTYCGFSSDRASTRRRTLSAAEVEVELQLLRGRGFHHVLLLTGEDEAAAPPGFLRASVAAAHALFSSVGVEVYPMSRQGYETLVAAGCDSVTLYQETYHQPTYAAVHSRGPKADFHLRLEGPAAAASAGMRQVSIGALLGLADHRIEGLLLAAHALGVQRASWRTRIGFGFPRLRNDPGGGVRGHPVSDRDLAQLVFALRLAFPDADLVLSTRERPALRDGLAGLAVTRMSAGSTTRPGGYSMDPARAGGEQFEIADRRSVAEVVVALADSGLEPVWKDWDRGFAP